jgi:hypothetical protein
MPSTRRHISVDGGAHAVISGDVAAGDATIPHDRSMVRLCIMAVIVLETGMIRVSHEADAGQRHDQHEGHRHGIDCQVCHCFLPG